MAAEEGVGRPAWYWVVATLGLLWNLVGVSSYLIYVGVIRAPIDPSATAAGGTAPGWLTGTFALAVFGGAFGSLGLLLTRRWARPLLLLSFAAALVQHLWVLVFSGERGQGPASIAVPLLVIAIAALLAWTAHIAVRRGWIG